MDTKKFLIAVAVCFLFLVASNYAIHGVWLNPVYEMYKDVWRPMNQQVAKMWVMLVGQFVFAVMFAWVYTRGAEEKNWLGQGIRYGAAVWLLAVVPCTLGEYVVFRVPYRLALTWLGVGLLQTVVLGLVAAYLLPKPRAGVIAGKTAGAPAKPA